MKLAIIGTGKIVKEALYAIQPVENIKPVSIYARPHSLETGKKLAGQYHIPDVFTDYEELLDKSDADTVYIGLVNSAHYSYALKALRAGKHVIMEKPFTVTLEEALHLQEEAEKRNLYLLEAINVLHIPAYQRMQENLHKIGPVRTVFANYSQYSSKYDDYLEGKVSPAFDPACSGGALMDINVYCLHYAAGLFGEPLKVHYFPNRGFNGIDTSGTIILEYEGFSAICTGSKDSDGPCGVTIQGERGWIHVDGKPNLAEQVSVTYVAGDRTARDGAGAVIREYVTENFTESVEYHRLTQEFRDFAGIIDERDAQRAKELLDESVTVMRILDAVRQDYGIIRR